MTESDRVPGENAAVPEDKPEQPVAPEQTGPAKGGRKKRSNNRRIGGGRILLIGLAFIAGFIVLGIGAVELWDYTNSVAFCTNVCHNVHPEETHAFQDSFHAEVKCTECHMGRVGTLQGIVLKAGHFRHLIDIITGNFQRPLVSTTMRPAIESCELCHYPPAFHGDKVLTIFHYLPDPPNTQERIYQLMHTGAGARTDAAAYGIHWHISSPVEYITTDPTEKQVIPWVRVTFPDGTTEEYNDVTNPLTPEEIATGTKKTMDCVDCHNRVGHPFLSPDALIDQAMANGQISADLPDIKHELSLVLSATYADQQQAQKAVSQFADRYKTDHPDVATTMSAQIDAAAQVASGMLDKLVFTAPGVTWQSFPDNSAHKDFAGCFRCHDGKHLSADGKAIRLECNICHGIPVTVGAEARVPQVPVATVREPASHLNTTFVADHRFLANQECSTCHGDIHFGSDNSGFCANSSCHGTAWPQVNLNAAFPHPIPLIGAHATVLCSQCHQGQAKPAYVCSNCHTPPAGHFTTDCSTCHTPVGWTESVASILRAAPVIPHGLAGRDDCLACHNPAGNIQPAPPNHSTYTNAQCTICHKTGQ